MASRIITKKGSGAPLASDLVHGELAVDTVNKRLYTENAGGTVIEVGTAPSTIDINAGTIDGTVIGGSSAAAGTFTSITGTSANINGTVTADGLTVNDGVTATAGYFFGNTDSYIYEGAADTANLRVGSDGPYMLLGNDLGSDVGGMGNVSGGLALYAGTEKIRITDAGNVGIGTSSPAEKLDVAGDAPTIRITDTRNSSSWATGEELGRFEFYTADDSGNAPYTTAYLSAEHDINGGTLPSGALVFGTAEYNAVGGAVERMRISSAGNVGIGTSAPDVFSRGYGRVFGISSASNAAIEINSANGSSCYFDMGINNVRYFGISVDSSNGYPFVGSVSSVPLLLGTNGTERMRIDNTGNVGIGTSSPNNTTHLKINTNGNGLTVQRNSTTTGDYAQVGFLASSTDSGTPSAWVRGYRGSTSGQEYLTFGSSNTERIRIDSSGNLLVGTSSSTFSSRQEIITSNASPVSYFFKNNSSTGAAIYVRHGGATGAQTANQIIFLRADSSAVGSITSTTTATAYNTSSDQRLKENITDAPAGNVDDIKVRSFDWKVDGSHQDYGMVAQELEAVAPYAVSKGETEDDMWSVDYSKLVPMLIKEIQDLKAEVAALKGAN